MAGIMNSCWQIVHGKDPYGNPTVRWDTEEADRCFLDDNSYNATKYWGRECETEDCTNPERGIRFGIKALDDPSGFTHDYIDEILKNREAKEGKTAIYEKEPLDKITDMWNGGKVDYNKMYNKDKKVNVSVLKVIANNDATIVIWQDNTKTIVKRKKGDKYDIYAAVAQALAKRVYGSSTHFHAIVDELYEDQYAKRKEKDRKKTEAKLKKEIE